MANLLEFVSNNAGGFVTGTIVAVLQLGVVYLWIDRRVERIQLKSEARKWKEARLELDASLLMLASSLVRPLAYYLRDSGQGVYFRDNFSSCLHHIVEKSASLDATLAIYSIGLEPASFTRITQTADHFRSVANYAAIALRNLDRIETDWGRQGDSAAPRIDGLQRSNGSIEFELPGDPEARAQKLFGYYLLLLVDGITEVAMDLSAIALRQNDADALDRGSRFARLKRISKGEMSATFNIESLKRDTATLRAIVMQIETSGVLLTLSPEVE